MFARMVAPVLSIVSGEVRVPGCLGLIRSFWPLVPRFADHIGVGAGRADNRTARPARVDCTHWLPCSSAMRLQLSLLLRGIATSHGARARPVGISGTRNGSERQSAALD